jgi:hypothetical protein
MTWEWSHTQEAYDQAYGVLWQKDPVYLRMCFAEWYAYDTHKDGSFDTIAYAEASDTVKSLSRYTIVNTIWDRASELRDCSNGGHVLYMCPYHCHGVTLQ